MEPKEKLGFAALAIGAGLVSLAQRPFFVLLGAIALYMSSESLFGVQPLKAYELSEVLAGAKEATIAVAGLVVAIASVSAFKRAKRLDLELAVASDIAAISSDVTKVLTRYSLYCEKILDIKTRFASRYDPVMRAVDRRKLDADLEIEWQLLLRWAKEIDVERDAVWSLIRRMLEVGEKHQAVIGSRFMTPILLERAQFHLEAIANAATFAVPSQDAKLLEYIRAFMLFGVQNTQRYLEVERTHRTKLLGSLGGASSIGANMIAPRSFLHASRLAWKLMRM